MSYVLTMGMGDALTDYQIGLRNTQQSVQVGGTIGAGVATAAVGAIARQLAASGGSILGITSAALSAAVPFIGPALMGATMLAQYLIANSGCGQTCIITSQWANQAADALQQNLTAYMSLPTPRTKTQQALALANFDSLWAQLQQACGQPGTGDAGKRCISDRQRGACTWKNNGQCWDWFIGYRDPIANDSVVADPTVAETVSSDLSSIFGGSASGSSLLPLALLGALVFVGVKVL